MFGLLCWGSADLQVRIRALLCGRRVDHRANLRDSIRRKPALRRMFADRLFIRSDVNAINLVVGNVTLHPLDVRTHFPQHTAGLLRDTLQLLGRQLARVRDFPLNNKFRHDVNFPYRRLSGKLLSGYNPGFETPRVKVRLSQPGTQADKGAYRFAVAIAIAAIAAVSARRIVLPSDAAVHPEFAKLRNSSSVQPPSAPIASARESISRDCSRSLSVTLRSFSASTTLRLPSIRRASASCIGFSTLGGAARRDCCEASRAIRRQRSTRFPAASARCFSVRRAMTGTIVATFSSVHFSIAHSMRSNLKIANSNVIGATAFELISAPSVNSTRSSATLATVARRT